MQTRLAITVDGKLTQCTASEENIGKGRCNHIAHQQEGQSVEEFIESIEEQIKIEEHAKAQNVKIETKSLASEIPDQKPIIQKLISNYANVENPDWENVIKDIKNPFHIGAESEGTLETAEMVDFKQVLLQNGYMGNTIKLEATYLFDGNEYVCDFGEVPAVNPDGTVVIDGSKWRILPVVEQNKGGIISYQENVIVKQADGNVCMYIPKDPNADYVTIYGKQIPIKDVEEYFRTGDDSNLTSGQVYGLNNIDPMALSRFPDLKENLSQFKTLEADDPGDLENRRVIRFEDMAKEQIQLQMRRMGVTFRSNLAKQRNPKNSEMTLDELDANFPLFYQSNLTNNIKSDLIGRSNVQNAENLNPIAALSQAQKISFTGPGGYNKDKVPIEIRMPHETHRETIDYLDVSSGKSVGLNANLGKGYIGDDRLIHKKEGETITPSDFIPYKLHDDPTRAIMGVAHSKQAIPIIGGEDPIVSTPAWDKIKGAKIGTNLRIAYISHKDCFEDACFISESAAEKMGTVKSKNYECFDSNALAGLKVGQRLEAKAFVGNSQIKTGGVVKSVYEEGFELETHFKMTPGDKVSNRHGAKSTVSRILPDKDMPKVLNERTGHLEPAQIVLSPTNVSGRKNLGQIMECNDAAGKGANITSKSQAIFNGEKIECTAGIMYTMRLNHLAEDKLTSYADEIGGDREFDGSRLGEMERMLLSTDSDRLSILRAITRKEQQDSHNKLNNLLKSVGVDMAGVNW